MLASCLEIPEARVRGYLSVGVLLLAGVAPAAAEESSSGWDYRLLATNKTSTMEKEMGEAAQAGYRFQGVMGGDTSFGGSEVVVVMARDPGAAGAGAFDYRLLATNKTSTMQKEISQAAELGFEYRGQTVFSTAFGGREVVVIMERPRDDRTPRHEYRLLATKKTSTMQKEISESAREGFAFCGLTVGETLFGGRELVVITKRPRRAR
jgi:hypothetical protein